MRNSKFLPIAAFSFSILIVLTVTTVAFAFNKDSFQETVQHSETTEPRKVVVKNVVVNIPLSTVSVKETLKITVPTPTAIAKALTQTKFTFEPTPSPTPVPVQAQVVPSPTPASQMQLSSLGFEQEYIMKAINEYRKSNGLSDVKISGETCAFAKTRANEIANNFDHDGFTSRVNSKTLPYSSYSEITENIAKTSNYKEVVDLWISSPGHAENMRKNTPFVCVEKEGNFYAYEGWRP